MTFLRTLRRFAVALAAGSIVLMYGLIFAYSEWAMVFAATAYLGFSILLATETFGPIARTRTRRTRALVGMMFVVCLTGTVIVIGTPLLQALGVIATPVIEVDQP